MLSDTNFENRIKKGMVVYSAEGEKLGKVSELTGETFVVEKGFFFPEERVFRLRDVLSLNDDEITISASRDSLTNVDADRMDDNDISYRNNASVASSTLTGGVAGMTSDLGGDRSGLDSGTLRAGAAYRSDEERSYSADRADFTDTTDITGSTSTSGSLGTGLNRTTSKIDIDDERILETGSREINVPLVEEEVVVDKNVREVGQVRIHKQVITENRHIEVPVTREEVVIERVATNRTPDASDKSLFIEQDIVVPVRVEEVEISKRAVVREEVRVKTEAVQEEKSMDAKVRKETVRIENEGSVDKIPTPPVRRPTTENRPST